MNDDAPKTHIIISHIPNTNSIIIEVKFSILGTLK